jgi:hypothetical protein
VERLAGRERVLRRRVYRGHESVGPTTNLPSCPCMSSNKIRSSPPPHATAVCHLKAWHLTDSRARIKCASFSYRLTSVVIF